MDNQEIIIHFWKNLNERQLSIIEEYCSPNITTSSYGISRAHVNNREEYKSEIDELFNAFPDYKLEIQKTIARDNEVWVYGIQIATQRESFHGFPATDNKFRIALFGIYTLEDGKIINEILLTDTLELYKKLGQAILTSNDKVKIKQYMDHLAKLGIVEKSKN